MYKMRVFSFCLPLAQDRDRNLSQEISIDVELPYIPRVGDALSVTPFQDITPVDETIFIPYDSDEFGRICVHLLMPDAMGDFEQFAAEGWKLA